MAAIIFDFDGTIGDSFEVIVDIFHRMTKRGKDLTEDEMIELRGLPLREVAKRLHVRWWQIPYLLIRGRYMMSKRMRDIAVFEGMPKVIEELHAEGHELFILSSNSARNVRKFLKHHHLYKYFVDIRGNAGLFSKAKALKGLVRGDHLALKTCVYIGDETRDVTGAKDAGMRCIAVSWGFADTKFLESLEPTAMAYKPQDIVRIFEEL